MGPTTIDGLPAHPLLVHLVVVAVPVAAVLLLLVVLWPAARRINLVAVAISVLALISVQLTIQAGNWLYDRIFRTPLIDEHAAAGADLRPWSIAVCVIAVAWWLVHSGRLRLGSGLRKGIAVALAVAAVVAAVGSVVQVYRIGDSGARAVWTGVVAP